MNRNDGQKPASVFDILRQQFQLQPMLGDYAGRSVNVHGEQMLPRAVAQLEQINRLNKIREVKNLQRYHEQPGKARWRIRMARKRRDFRQGMKTLFHLALQAQKRKL